MPNFRPTIAARPSTPGHKTCIATCRSSITRPSISSPQAGANASARTAELLRQADRDLANLRAKLNIPNRPDKPLSMPVQPDLSRDEDQAAALKLPNAKPHGVTVENPTVTVPVAPRPTTAEARSLPVTVTSVVSVVLAALALFTSILVYVLQDGKLAVQAQQSRVQTAALSRLTDETTAFARNTKTRIDALQQLVSEVKYPPLAFEEAQHLMRAGRYADAEAAYHAFLLRSPTSRVADAALHNAAIAAAMGNNCGMASSYLERLKSRFPDSPLLVRSKGLVAHCNALRVKPANLG